MLFLLVDLFLGGIFFGFVVFVGIRCLAAALRRGGRGCLLSLRLLLVLDVRRSVMTAGPGFGVARATG